VLSAPEAGQHRLRLRRIHEVQAGAHLSDRAHDLVAAELLQQVPGGARHQRREEGLVVVEGRQHQHPGLGQLAPDLAGRLDAAVIPQADIHDDDIRVAAEGVAHRFRRRAGLIDELHPGGALDQSGDAVADQLVVVDDHHAKRPISLLIHLAISFPPNRSICQRPLALPRSGPWQPVRLGMVPPTTGRWSLPPCVRLANAAVCDENSTSH